MSILLVHSFKRGTVKRQREVNEDELALKRDKTGREVAGDHGTHH